MRYGKVIDCLRGIRRQNKIIKVCDGHVFNIIEQITQNKDPRQNLTLSPNNRVNQIPLNLGLCTTLVSSKKKL